MVVDKSLHRPFALWAVAGSAAAGLLIAVIAWAPVVWWESKVFHDAPGFPGPHLDPVWQFAAFLLLATISSLAVALALFGFKSQLPHLDRPPPLSQRSLKQAGSRLDKEASTIAALIASSADSHESYAESLGVLEDKIATVQTPEQLRAIASLLAAENHRMRFDTRSMTRKLEASRSQVEALRSDLERAQEEGLRDALTNVSNRRAFDIALEEAVGIRTADDKPLSIIMIDIDAFKAINDRYGHQAGDTVLRAFAKLLVDGVNQPSTVTRFGGEEFAVILPGLNSMAAAVLAERLRAKIQSEGFDTGTAGRLRLTASLGLAQWRDGESASSLVSRADERLYRAKNLGRNRVVTV